MRSFRAWKHAQGRCNTQLISAGEVEIRPDEFMAAAEGQPLQLTVRELELLTALVGRAGPDREPRGALQRGLGRALPQVRPLG